MANELKSAFATPKVNEVNSIGALELDMSSPISTFDSERLFRRMLRARGLQKIDSDGNGSIRLEVDKQL